MSFILSDQCILNAGCTNAFMPVSDTISAAAHNRFVPGLSSIDIEITLSHPLAPGFVHRDINERIASVSLD